MAHSKSTLSIDQKYRLYEKSVQDHLSDIDFINREYPKIKGGQALTLREDFCGTAALACAWAKQSAAHRAWGIDLDPEPIAYGMRKHYRRMGDKARARMNYIQGNVLDDHPLKVDVTCAFNFSYFIFKERRQLLHYFRQVHRGLKKNGVFFLDIFGGTECLQALVEETEFSGHTYYWDCRAYNPLNNETDFAIHFKTKKDGVKYRNAFTYDWRHWSVREVTEALEEAGFASITTYWEGDDENGDGNGEYTPSKKEENCLSWVCYISATTRLQQTE